MDWQASVSAHASAPIGLVFSFCQQHTGIVFRRTSVTSAVNNTRIVFKRTTNNDP